MSAIRQDRMNEEVKKVVSEIIREMKDPRISTMTTVTQANVTNDLKQAKLYVSVYEKNEDARKQTVQALNHAAGFITKELGNRMQIRRLPTMKFLLDTSIEYSVHIAGILSTLHIPDDGEPADEDA
ncbi:30S ribosome-binding factor RbfA [Christensenellaceae bacterium OttesenSCG-928-L17]|nr:30S ribosome-binding factor RbfA [Christensenellaceae bacterium OttesenSCG-928-L17]